MGRSKDWGTFALVIAVNVVALSWLLQKLDFERVIDLEDFMFWSSNCGHYKHDDYLLYSQRTVLSQEIAAAAVHVREGKIVSVIKPGSDTANATYLELFRQRTSKLTSTSRWLDVGDAVVSPGLIDTHVHFDEPGREHWEGFSTGSQAAAAGGVTTCVDMPLNALPPTITPESFKEKAQLAKKKVHVDVGFWAGLVPQNANDSATLTALMEAGALGFKAFLSPAGTEFDHVNRQDVENALPVLKRLGAPLYIHAELVDTIAPKGDPHKYQTFLQTRPKRFEAAAVSMLIDVLRAGQKQGFEEGFELHIAHLGNADMLPLIKAAKADGLPLSVETAPHLILFADEDVADRNTLMKCMPPLRDAANRDGLRRGLQDGIIDTLASDHSPVPGEAKLLQEGDFMRAWGGVAGLQYSLPATLASMQRHSPEVTQDQLLLRMAELWSRRPAVLAGMHMSKGAIEAGLDADFVVWRPEEQANTTSQGLYQKHKETPFAGILLPGKVELTILRGHVIFNSTASTPVAPQICGKTLLYRDVETPNRGFDFYH